MYKWKLTQETRYAIKKELYIVPHPSELPYFGIWGLLLILTETQWSYRGGILASCLIWCDILLAFK